MKCAGGDTDSAVTSESTCSRGPRSESAALFASRRTTWWQRHRLPSVQNSQPSLIAHLCDGEAVRTAARGEESERESGVCELRTDLTNYLLSFRIRKKEKITYSTAACGNQRKTTAVCTAIIRQIITAWWRGMEVADGRKGGTFIIVG